MNQTASGIAFSTSKTLQKNVLWIPVLQVILVEKYITGSIHFYIGESLGSVCLRV